MQIKTGEVVPLAMQLSEGTEEADASEIGNVLGGDVDSFHTIYLFPCEDTVHRSCYIHLYPMAEIPIGKVELVDFHLDVFYFFLALFKEIECRCCSSYKE